MNLHTFFSLSYPVCIAATQLHTFKSPRLRWKRYVSLSVFMPAFILCMAASVTAPRLKAQAGSSINPITPFYPVQKVQFKTTYNKVAKIELGSLPADLLMQVRLAAPAPTLAEENTIVELYTAVEGEESPRWLHNYETVLPNERIKLIGRTLRIEKLQAEDAGIYSTEQSVCMALAVGKSGNIVNSSARAFVGTGEKVLVTGLVIDGTKTKKFLIRAIGPGLARFGVKDFLPEPMITVFDSKGKEMGITPSSTANIIGGASYRQQIEEATIQVGAFPLQAGIKDCVELRPMTPGLYTIQVSGLNGSTGVALVEAYEIKESDPH